jgi:hypothetical protein
MSIRATAALLAMVPAVAIGQIQAPTATGAREATSPAEYWQQHAKGGFMSEEAAAAYPSPDGHKADFAKIDADKDGKVSQSEWVRYHGEAVTKEPSAGTLGGTPR